MSKTEKVFPPEIRNLGEYENNKVAFIDDTYDNIDTKLTYYRLFRLFVNFERVNNKDLYAFTKEELLESIGSIPTYSKRTINTIDSLLKQYMDWAIRRKYNLSHINPMDHISVKDHLEKNINTNLLSKRFLTKDGLYKAVSKCENAQDAITVLLPFYGIYGKACSEMINLKWEHINEHQNEIHIITENDSESRFIKVDKELIEYLKKANQETIYYRAEKEGAMPLMDFGYILKIPNRKNNASDTISAVTIRQRMQKVMNMDINKEYKMVTIKSIVASGKFHKLEEIKMEKGNLTDEDFRDVMIEFGDNPKSYFTLKEDYYFVNKAD